jgi:Predicted nucleotide-binding protein containing TIR-like domain
MVYRPVVFIGSSSESLAIAEAVQAELQGSQEVEAVLWKRLFEPGDITLQALDEKAGDFDFAVLILSGDDVLESRGATSKAPRDNLLFETGLFVGRLGRNRTFYLFKASERPKLPSDLAGTTGVEYTDPGFYGLQPALAPACQQLRSRFQSLGPRNRTTRCPALRIDFSYLPDVTLEARGWRKGHNSPAGTLAEIEVLNDRRFGLSLVMKAEVGAYIDYYLPYLIEATDVEFVVKGGRWVLYPIIDVKHSSQARTMESVYLRLSEKDRQVQKLMLPSGGCRT